MLIQTLLTFEEWWRYEQKRRKSRTSFGKTAISWRLFYKNRPVKEYERIDRALCTEKATIHRKSLK